MEHIRILQALRLKGRIRAADLSAATGIDAAQCEAVLGRLSEEGRATQSGERWKLTPTGREYLEEQLAQERSEVDQRWISELYHQFDEHNSALKALMTRWQLKSEDTPNDHSDTAYDDAVIADLALVHSNFQPLLDEIIRAAPRLTHYPLRLTSALAQVQSGDHSWFARPLTDSYHTVWFELHEDLIGLAGLSRIDEAAAGRAQ